MATTHHLPVTPETPITAGLVQHFADAVMADIAKAGEEGTLGGYVTCWHDLHSRLDTGTLASDAGVPWGADIATDGDPSGSRWITAVEAAVDAQLHDASWTEPCGRMAATDEVAGPDEAKTARSGGRSMASDPFECLPDGTRTIMTGTLITWQRHISHQGNPHGTGTILTLAGPVEINVFARPYAIFGHLIVKGEVREWTGIVDLREGALLSVRSISEVDRARLA